MTNPTMTTRRELGKCPACGNPLEALVQMEVRLDEPTYPEGGSVLSVPESVPATVNLLGVELRHDCIRKATR